MNVKLFRAVNLREFIVESESNEGSFYLVAEEDNKWSCTCKHHVNRKVQCKHIVAATKHDY